MFEEESSDNRTRKYQIIGLISIIIGALLIFFLVRGFVFKPPKPPRPPSTITPGSPEEAAINYLQSEQADNRELAETYLHPTAQIEIFKEYYRDIKSSLTRFENQETVLDEDNEEVTEAEYQVKESQVKDNVADVVVEEITNKKEGSLFLGFILPKKITFEITLLKYKDDWKIFKLNSPDLVLDRKIGEKAEIKKNIFVKLIQAEDYIIKGRKPKRNFKLLSLEVEYENKSKNPVSFQPFSEWKVISIENRKSYNPMSLRSLTRTPELKEGKLNAGSIKKGYVSFNVPENILIYEIIFQNLERKIIFEFPQKAPPIKEP